ncbi:hypothetical protein ScalyP_jg12136 [Parmales sp. scaly parma]|nr:hypothetical protein ScalyP_jg12136 [Parmales sp. scaly parma]
MDSDLRSKHIETLEVLQKLSDENTELKAKSAHPIKDTETAASSAQIDALLKMVENLRHSVKATEAALIEERERSEISKSAAAADRKTLQTKFTEERRTKNQIMKDIETQGLLMAELRRQLDEEAKDPSLPLPLPLPQAPQEVEVPPPEIIEELSAVKLKLESVVSERDSLLLQIKEQHNLISQQNIDSSNSIHNLEEEIGRQKLETATLNGELQRLSSELNTIKKTDLVRLKLELKNQLSVIEKLEKEVEALNAARPETRVVTEDPKVSSSPPPQSEKKKFEEYVKLKKENSIMRIQLQQLQRTGQHRKVVKF